MTNTTMNNTYILHSSEIGHKQGFSRLSRPLVTNVGYTLPHSTVRHSGTQRNTVEHRETQWNTEKHSGTQRNTTRTQWNTEKHNANTVEHRETQWSTEKHNANTVEHRETQWSTEKHNRIQWSVSQASAAKSVSNTNGHTV
jgi:hypothetical protein